MITQLETEIARSQRLKHASRYPYAAACVLRSCGYKVAFARSRPSMHVRAGRCWVYDIQGIGEAIGQHELREKLWEAGVKCSIAAISRRMSDGKGNAEIGGFKVRAVAIQDSQGRHAVDGRAA